MDVGINDLKTNLPTLLKQIEESGDVIRVTRHGKPIAGLKMLLAERTRP